LILDEANAIPQMKLAFFEALNLQEIGPWDGLQRFNRSVKIAMLLPQLLELCLQLGFFFFGHRSRRIPMSLPRYPASERRRPAADSRCRRARRAPSKEGKEARPGLYRAHPEKFCLPDTTIGWAMLPESLPQDQVVGQRTRAFMDDLRHLDHTEKFNERQGLSMVR
jgi:hypothetical protein